MRARVGQVWSSNRHGTRHTVESVEKLSRGTRVVMRGPAGNTYATTYGSLVAGYDLVEDGDDAPAPGPAVTGTAVTWLSGETRLGKLMIGDDWHAEHDTREEAETYAREMRTRGYGSWRAYAVVELPDGDGDEPAGVPAVVAPAPMPSDAARRLLAAAHGITPGELALNGGDEP